MLSAFLLIVSTIQSTVVEARLRHHRNAQLVDPVEALVVAEPSSSTLSAVTTTTLSMDTSILDILQTTPSITAFSSTSSSSSTTCTPRSICVDGVTCSIRYGGCYDANYCDGNTSPYPIPTCDSSPADGLTSNNVDGTPQRVDNDIAAAVIAQNLVEDPVRDD